jgi:large subunit ribosomal protein L23
MNISQIILRPVLTEKSVKSASLNKFTFIVHENANKISVKRALKDLYGVKVVKINMLRTLPKYKWSRGRKLVQKRPRTHRAIVTLKAGEKLDLSKLKNQD